MTQHYTEYAGNRQPMRSSRHTLLFAHVAVLRALWRGFVPLLPKRLRGVELPPLCGLNAVSQMLTENLESWTEWPPVQWQRIFLQGPLKRHRQMQLQWKFVIVAKCSSVF